MLTVIIKISDDIIVQLHVHTKHACMRSDYCSVSLSENLIWTRLLFTGGTRSLDLSPELSRDLSADLSLFSFPHKHDLSSALCFYARLLIIIG